MKIIFYNQFASKVKDLFIKLKLKLFGKNEVFYINGSETLPPPLKASEEKKIMEMLQKGHEEYREKLIVHNLRLVVYIAKKFESQGSNLEDMISIGTIGLIKAVNTFSPQRNIKLATYASRCIENEILMHLRKTSQLKNEVSIDEPLSSDWDGNELLLYDVLGSEPDTVNINIEKELETKELLHAVAKLSERERTIMELRFGLNGKKEHTQKQVADMLGISQSYISRLEKKIIARLRGDLEKTVFQ
ncbi:MAG: RNA polymerase sporulation sigma factor SigE [Ruminococcus sp.]